MDYYLFLFYFEEHLKFYEILCISYNLIYDMYILRLNIGECPFWHHSCVADYGSEIRVAAYTLYFVFFNVLNLKF
jgi:hypothetical protein